MEKFNEYHHAYICGYLYDELKKAFGEQGKLAFIKATQFYGEQRGGRMALRAIRDGRDLSYDSYFHYVEWRATPGLAEIERTVTDGVMLSENFVCPWHTALKEMGLSECGAVYCRHIDASLVRGFNPELKFEAETILHTSNSCKLKFYIGKPIEAFEKGDAPIVYDMEYHCAHLLWTFAEVIENIFGKDGNIVVINVKERFAEKYSKEMIDALEMYRDCNFTYLPDGDIKAIE
ncbi:MAG: L-2-amino-thiazoline-4-carboxylic acid hydrolase [Lachnospiraceae bacterium]